MFRAYGYGRLKDWAYWHFYLQRTFNRKRHDKNPIEFYKGQLVLHGLRSSSCKKVARKQLLRAIEAGSIEEGSRDPECIKEERNKTP